jgi:hypothetical protein
MVAALPDRPVTAGSPIYLQRRLCLHLAHQAAQIASTQLDKPVEMVWHHHERKRSG